MHITSIAFWFLISLPQQLLTALNGRPIAWIHTATHLLSICPTTSPPLGGRISGAGDIAQCLDHGAALERPEAAIWFTLDVCVTCSSHNTGC